MRKTDPFVAVLIVISAIGFIVILSLPRGDGGGASGSPPREPERDTSSSPTRPRPPTGRLALPTDPASALRELQQADDPAPAATELRARGLASKDFLRALIAKMDDTAADRVLRDRLALILGSIADPEVEQALRLALARGGKPDRIATLLLALGMGKTLEDPFGEDRDAPYVISHASGLKVFVFQAIADDLLVDEIGGHLSHESDAVRRAAHRALQGTLLFEADRRELADEPAMRGVRTQFLERLRGEPVEGLRAAFAQSLAEWASRSGHSKEKQETLGRLVESALEGEATTVRLRTAAGLSNSDLGEPLRRRLNEAVRQGSFDTRTWAMGVLSAQVPRMSAPELDAYRGALLDGLKDPEAKVREHAMRSMARVPGSEPLVVQAMSDEAWNVRVAAAQALKGTASRESRQALERLRDHDSDERVRKAAAETLGR